MSCEITKGQSMLTSSVTNLFIPVGADDVVNSKYFIGANESFSGLTEAFNSLHTGEITTGKVYIVNHAGKNFIFATIKAIDKYAANVNFILDCYFDLLGKVNEFNIHDLAIPVMNYQVTKLFDAVCIPLSIDYLSMFNLPIKIYDNDDTLKYYLNNHDEENDIFSWKPDTSKFNKFISDDDVLFVAVLNRVSLTMNTTISKNKLVRIYELCQKEFGLYPDFEFYKTDYGRYFKEFNLKFFSIVNNGMMRQKGRSGLVIGPGMSYYLLSNSSRVMNMNKKVHKIAKRIGEQFKDKPMNFKPKEESPSVPKINEPLF